MSPTPACIDSPSFQHLLGLCEEAVLGELTVYINHMDLCNFSKGRELGIIWGKGLLRCSSIFSQFLSVMLDLLSLLLLQKMCSPRLSFQAILFSCYK